MILFRTHDRAITFASLRSIHVRHVQKLHLAAILAFEVRAPA